MILVTGATGSGTTLLGAQFAKAGLDAGERVLLLSFEGRTSRRSRAMSARGGSISRRRYGRAACGSSRYAERMGLEDLLVQIEHEFEQSGARRVVFDSMTALEHNAPARAFGEFGVGLSGFLMARSVAGLVTTTSDSLLGGVSVAGVALSTVADSIIALRYLELDGRLRRGVVVVKLRGQRHDRAIHECEITDEGLRILAPVRGVAGILAGRASFVGDEGSAMPAEGDTSEPGGT